MIYYRYFKADHAKSSLQDMRLKVAKISEFNDPFELAWRNKEQTIETTQKMIRERLEDPAFLVEIEKKNLPKNAFQDLPPERLDTIMGNAIKASHGLLEDRFKQADEYLRLISFSNETTVARDEILMWSHYADKHLGVRIGFDFPESILKNMRKVDYLNERIELDTFSDGSNMKANLISSLKTKSNAWFYEAEHRLILSPQNCKLATIDGKGFEFFDLDSNWIYFIDIGLRCDMENDFLQLKNQLSPNAIVRKARMHASDYSLEFELL